MGARVIGTVRNKGDIPKPGTLPVDVWIDLEDSELAIGTRNVTSGNGADVALDVVGGAMFEKCLAALVHRGRQVAISSTSAPRVGLNLVEFYHNESRLIGVDTLRLGFSEAAKILQAISAEIEQGHFPPPEVQPWPLERGPDAYREIDAGKIKGKIVLTP